MIDRVGELTKAFHAIDANMAEGTVKVQCDVNSTPAHVQGTSLNVNEPVGHVSSVPVNVIDLVSHSSGEQRQDTAPKAEEKIWVNLNDYKIGE